MRISKHQIREFVYKEVGRNQLVSYSRKDEILNEGILDFLKDMWGKASEYFSKTIDDVSEKFSEIMKDAVEKSLEKNKSDSDDEDFDDEEIGALSDLNPKDNAKHRVLYFKSISAPIIKVLEKSVKDLESTKSVKRWTPKSGSKEDLQSWMKENKDASSGLWRSVGGIKSSMKLLSESGASFDAPESPKENANPGEAIKYILSSCKAMKKVWEKMSAEVKDESKNVISSISKAESAASKVGKAIANSAKTQQKEWVNLKMAINSIIIQERILQGEKMRITESQLRKTIRKAIKEFSMYQPLYGTEEEIPEEPEQRIHVADTEIESGICPACHGKGIIMGRDCRMCDGTGEFEE